MPSFRLTSLRFTMAMILLTSLWADMRPLYWSSFLLFDELLVQARDSAALKDSAFRFFRVVAEGRKDEISLQLLTSFRLRANTFHPVQLNEIGVRAQAFEHIGRLATPEALAYLESIDCSQFSAVEDQPLEKAVVMGIYLARLGQITDQQRRWEFQAGLLAQRTVNRGDGDVKGRALNELCSDGALAFLPDVEAYHRKWGSSPEEEDRIQRCKAKMLLVASHPDRVMGLASALQLDANNRDAEILRSWALQELAEMNTRESRAVLEKFVRDAKAAKGEALRGSRLGNDVSSAEIYLMRLAP